MIYYGRLTQAVKKQQKKITMSPFPFSRSSRKKSRCPLFPFQEAAEKNHDVPFSSPFLPFARQATGFIGRSSRRGDGSSYARCLRAPARLVEGRKNRRRDATGVALAFSVGTGHPSAFFIRKASDHEHLSLRRLNLSVKSSLDCFGPSAASNRYHGFGHLYNGHNVIATMAHAPRYAHASEQTRQLI